jgi:thymidylate kinase
MKKIILLEGIASSGKTTLEKLLVQRIEDSAVISEDETLMPVIENKDAVAAKAHLQKILKMILDHSAQNLIIDRFHFTHAFRTQSSFDAFLDIETELKKVGNVLVALLTIEPGRIRERIEDTILHRKDKWKKGAQGSIEEKVTYYTKQQEVLLSFVSLSCLPTVTIDTTQKNWDVYVDEIIDRFYSNLSVGK